MSNKTNTFALFLTIILGAIVTGSGMMVVCGILDLAYDGVLDSEAISKQSLWVGIATFTVIGLIYCICMTINIIEQAASRLTTSIGIANYKEDMRGHYDDTISDYGDPSIYYASNTKDEDSKDNRSG